MSIRFKAVQQPAESIENTLRVAVAHEWLIRYAGSERVVEEILAEFPNARLLTTMLDPLAVPGTLRQAETSFLQKLPGARRHHEWVLPLMPLAWRARGRLTDLDVVISSSHACAKAVRVVEAIPHLCYCHTPMRYAWDFDAEKERFPSLVRPFARAGMAWFRRWDKATAARVTAFVANSTAVAERIRRWYGRSSKVIHPPVRTDFFTPDGGGRDDYFLFVGRLAGYKRADLVIETFFDLDRRLLVVGEGQQRRALETRASSNVSFLGSVEENRLRELYRRTRAVIYPAEEDFGIVMAEAQACGTPVLAYRRGGAVDIVTEGVTGVLVERQDVAELRRAIEQTKWDDFDTPTISSHAQRFSAARFRRELREEVEAVVAGFRNR